MANRKTYHLYCITNLENGKQYIGATYRKVEQRFGQHISDALNNRGNGCTSLKNAMREFGEKCFNVSTLLVCNEEQIDFYEDRFINLYNTLHPSGYNLKTGGRSGCKLLDETKKQIAESNRGKFVGDETRVLIGSTSKYRNMSESNKQRLKNALAILGLDDLPMYITLSVDRRYNRNVDKIVVNVPTKKNRQFSKKDMPLHEKIRLAIEYKISIE
jgi:group I intron endonuclease